VSTTLNMAVVAPIPVPRIRIAARENPGLLRNERNANLMSRMSRSGSHCSTKTHRARLENERTHSTVAAHRPRVLNVSRYRSRNVSVASLPWASRNSYGAALRSRRYHRSCSE